MTAHTLPSGQEHHFREREFKRSFTISLAIHLVVFIAAGSVTLFKMSGTTYSPTYTVDLVSLPPAPASKPSPVKAPAKRTSKPKPVKATEKKPEKAVAAREVPPPEQSFEEVRPAGGDEAARVERRKRIEELEQEARRLYESYTTEDTGEAEEAVTKKAEPVERPGSEQSVSGVQSAVQGNASDLRSRAYYDQVWAKIRASWVLPEAVTSGDSLLTVIGIRISSMGEIQQSWVERSSGNSYYDQSAIRAIRKASPVPPLPDELEKEFLEVGVNFRYPD